jgi:hypothetical protein
MIGSLIRHRMNREKMRPARRWRVRERGVVWLVERRGRGGKEKKTVEYNERRKEIWRK